MSKKDELRAGLMSTFSLLNLPASELEKAKQLAAGENSPDVIVGGEEKKENTPRSTAAAVAEPPESTTGRLTFRAKRAPATASPGLRKMERAATPEGPRYTNFMAHTYRLHEEQIDTLNRIEAEIVRNGVPKQERITNNSILRALVDVLARLNLNVAGIDSETELKRRIFEKCGLKTTQPSVKLPSDA